MRIDNSTMGCVKFLEEATEQIQAKVQKTKQLSNQDVVNLAEMLVDRLDAIKKEGLPIKPMYVAMQQKLQKTKPSAMLSEKKLMNMRPPEVKELAEDLL